VTLNEPPRSSWGKGHLFRSPGAAARAVNRAPLYAGYGERFEFSTGVLALIFATYAIVLIPSLLLFGQVSDRFGRRSVITVGLGVAMAGLGCFAVADGLAWLFAARALLGLAQGMVYTGVAGPVIGILAAAISLYAAVSVFAAVTGVVALIVAGWHLRHRDADERTSAEPA
jgi:MFS family permease